MEKKLHNRQKDVATVAYLLKVLKLRCKYSENNLGNFNTFTKYRLIIYSVWKFRKPLKINRNILKCKVRPIFSICNWRNRFYDLNVIKYLQFNFRIIVWICNNGKNWLKPPLLAYGIISLFQVSNSHFTPTLLLELNYHFHFILQSISDNFS